jgi:hypothetical protein
MEMLLRNYEILIKLILLDILISFCLQFYLMLVIIQIQFKALFWVDINHTYNTSSNELLKSIIQLKCKYKILITRCYIIMDENKACSKSIEIFKSNHNFFYCFGWEYSLRCWVSWEFQIRYITLSIGALPQVCKTQSLYLRRHWYKTITIHL